MSLNQHQCLHSVAGHISSGWQAACCVVAAGQTLWQCLGHTGDRQTKTKKKIIHWRDENMFLSGIITLFALAHFVWRCDFLLWLGLTNASPTGMPLWCQSPLQVSRLQASVTTNMVQCASCAGHKEGPERAHHLKQFDVNREGSCSLQHAPMGSKHLICTSLAFPTSLSSAFGPFHKSKSEPCPRKCKQPYLNIKLVLQPNSAEGRMHEGLDWCAVMRLLGQQCLQPCPLCLPFCLCHCPDTVNISPTAALTPSAPQTHPPQEFALTCWGWTWVAAMQAQKLMCRCCCGAGTSLQRAGDSQGLRHPTPLHQDLLKPVHQRLEVLFFKEILLSFSTADSALHCPCRSHPPNSGKCDKDLQGQKGEFCFPMCCIHHSGFCSAINTGDSFQIARDPETAWS